MAKNTFHGIPTTLDEFNRMNINDRVDWALDELISIEGLKPSEKEPFSWDSWEYSTKIADIDVKLQSYLKSKYLFRTVSYTRPYDRLWRAFIRYIFSKEEEKRALYKDEDQCLYTSYTSFIDPDKVFTYGELKQWWIQNGEKGRTKVDRALCINSTHSYIGLYSLYTPRYRNAFLFVLCDYLLKKNPEKYKFLEDPVSFWTTQFILQGYKFDNFPKYKVYKHMQ